MKNIYIILILFNFISCSKKDADKEPPQITITSPASSQHFSIQDNILVNATASDNIQLKSVSLRVLDSAMYLLQPMYATQTFDIPVNKKDYQFSKSFPVGINFKNTWRFTFTATDMSGNQTVKEVLVPIN